MKVPPRSLVMGSPGKVKRTLTDAEVADIQAYADRYVGYRLDYMNNASRLNRRAGRATSCPTMIRRREHVIGVVRDVYERYGFEPLETPAFENIETLLGKYGEEGNKLIFKILKRGEHEVERRGRPRAALRSHRSARARRRAVPERAAEVLQALSDSAGLARRPSGAGRFREFFQCDIDAIGSTSPVVEVELLAAVSEVLTTLGFADFTIRLNHRQAPGGDAGGGRRSGGAARRRAGRARQARQDRRDGVSNGTRSPRRRSGSRDACLDAVREDCSPMPASGCVSTRRTMASAAVADI